MNKRGPAAVAALVLVRARAAGTDAEDLEGDPANVDAAQRAF